MAYTQVSAELIVSDHDGAVAWYERLFGRGPDRRPMDGLAEWQIIETACIQVFADASKAGQSVVTIGVDDLDQHVQIIASNGLELDRQTTPRGQQLGSLSDPDGNLIVFAEDLKTTS